jgi:lipopolysaccharide/colanic/teichoic acid biosynthesis glycosyltransferase
MADNFSMRVQLLLKRALDIIVSLFLLIFNFPLLLLIAVLVKLDSPGPAIYRHRRVGKDGRPFDMYKFRTMVTGGDDATYMAYLRELIESAKNNPDSAKPYIKMKDDPRVTRVGKILRTLYLDELPQLINVLKGELSLVGPRPHVQFEVDHYTPEQRRRLAVKPGMTGLWQVQGKADCTFDELLAYDLEYIDNWSLALDLKIILTTLMIMLRGGEAFWSRATKRIPRRNGSGGNHRGNGRNGSHRQGLPEEDCYAEDQTEEQNRFKARLLSALRRWLPEQEDPSLERISSIKE